MNQGQSQHGHGLKRPACRPETGWEQSEDEDAQLEEQYAVRYLLFSDAPAVENQGEVLLQSQRIFIGTIQPER